MKQPGPVVSHEIVARSRGTALVAESSSAGVKKYVKMINGIPTDDYYVEAYQHGKLVQVTHSPETVTATEIEVATSQLAETDSINTMVYADDSVQSSELMFKHINGELRLVRVHTVIDETAPSQICVIYETLLREE